MIPLIHFNSHTVYDSACGGAWCVEVLAGFADEHLPRPWYVDISCFSHDDITPYSSDKPYYHQFCGPSSQPLAKTLAQMWEQASYLYSEDSLQILRTDSNRRMLPPELIFNMYLLLEANNKK